MFERTRTCGGSFTAWCHPATPAESIRSRSRTAGRSEATNRAGEALLMSATEPSISTLHSGGRFLTLSVPRDAISSMVVEAGWMLVRPILGHGGALQLLTGYLGILREADKVSGPELQRMVVSHIHDLLASALGATQDAAIVAEQRGIRSARLRAIMLNIVENLDKRQ